MMMRCRHQNQDAPSIQGRCFLSACFHDHLPLQIVRAFVMSLDYDSPQSDDTCLLIMSDIHSQHCSLPHGSSLIPS